MPEIVNKMIANLVIDMTHTVPARGVCDVPEAVVSSWMCRPAAKALVDAGSIVIPGYKGPAPTPAPAVTVTPQPAGPMTQSQLARKISTMTDLDELEGLYVADELSARLRKAVDLRMKALTT